MAAYTVITRQNWKDGTLTHHLTNTTTWEEEPLVQWSLEQVQITDELLRLGEKGQVRGFRWLWKPYLLRLCGVTWLVGSPNVLWRTYPAWCANLPTFFFWLAAWLWEATERRLLWPFFGFLVVQGVLVVPECEERRYRRLWHYLTAPGHREQRRYYHPTRNEIDCLSYTRGYDDGKREAQQSIAKELETYLQERRRR